MMFISDWLWFVTSATRIACFSVRVSNWKLPCECAHCVRQKNKNIRIWRMPDKTMLGYQPFMAAYKANGWWIVLGFRYLNILWEVAQDKNFLFLFLSHSLGYASAIMASGSECEIAEANSNSSWVRNIYLRANTLEKRISTSSLRLCVK